TPTPSRTLLVRLEKGGQASGKLKELSGTLLVQALSDPEMVLAVDDILQAAGKTIKASPSKSVQVRSIERRPGGDVKITLVGGNVDGANGGGAPGLNGANIVINGVNLNRLAFAGNEPVTRNEPRLLDAAGKAWTLADVLDDHTEVSNGQPTHVVS